MKIIVGALVAVLSFPALAIDMRLLQSQQPGDEALRPHPTAANYGELLYYQRTCPDLRVSTNEMRLALIRSGIRVDASLEVQNAVNIALNQLALHYQAMRAAPRKFARRRSISTGTMGEPCVGGLSRSSGVRW